MNLLRTVTALGCVAGLFGAVSAEDSPVVPKGPLAPIVAPELQPLQGTWEGVATDDPARARITLRISGNRLHFHRDTNFWFDTTVKLSPDASPRRFHATIKACPASQKDSVGAVVGAIYKIEDGMLVIATAGDGADGVPKGFDPASERGITRYELRKPGQREGGGLPGSGILLPKGL